MATRFAYLRFGPAASLALLVLMKLANQFATFNYALFNSNIYELVNQSSNECRLKPPLVVIGAQKIRDPVQFNFFRFAYTLTAIGGLLSSAARNRRLILVLAGCVMTLSAVGVYIVRALGLACNRLAYVLSWLPYPVFMILIMAPLLSAFADCRCPSFGWEGSRTVALVLYYVAASSTVWFNLGVWKLADINIYQHSHEFIAGAAAVLGIVFLIACCLICPSAAAASVRQPFEMPTMRRLLRYFLILTAFTLFLVQLNDGHIFGYNDEALHYMNTNATDRLDQAVLYAFRNWNVPRTVNIVGMLMSSVFVAVFAGSRRIRASTMLRLPFQDRLLFGISLGGVVAAFGLTSDLLMRAIFPQGLPALIPGVLFSLAGFAEGCAEIFANVAAYELTLAIAPSSHRDFVVGIALSVWSTATLLRSALQDCLVPLIVPKETISRNPHVFYCLTHVLDLLLCVACLAYTRLVSLRLAAPLMVDEDETIGTVNRYSGGDDSEDISYDEANGELQRLLNN